jgi:hypothetical protein
MKEEYRKPEIEVILFSQDVITESGENDDDLD